MASKCEVCGAPDDGSQVICSFCGQAVSAQAVQTAVPCPKCQTRNRAGQVDCIKCNAPLPQPPPPQAVPVASSMAGGAPPTAGGSLGASIDRGNPPRMPSY